MKIKADLLCHSLNWHHRESPKCLQGIERISSRMKNSMHNFKKRVKDHRPVQSVREICWETFQPEEVLVVGEVLGLQNEKQGYT